MIHLVTRRNRHLYQRQLQQFRAAGGHEDGPYGDDDALHVLAIDARGDLGVGARLRPTIRGSVVADRFPNLIASDRSLFCGAETLEASGLILACRGNHRTRRARGELGLAMLEAARLSGASRIVGVVPLTQWPMLDASGWRMTPLGVPIRDRRGIYIAFEVGTSAEDVRVMRDAWNIERALVHLDDRLARVPAVATVDERTRPADLPPGWPSAAPRDADRDALEEVLQILDTVIDRQMLQRPDNDLRQQGAIMLLSVAQSRLRGQLADVPPSPVGLGGLPLSTIH